MDTYHIVLQIDFKNNQYDLAMSSVNMSNRSRSSGANSISCDLPIRSEIFFELFPFHLIFKKSLEIISVGSGLRLAMKNIDGELVKDLFNINRPMVTFSYENVRFFILIFTSISLFSFVYYFSYIDIVF